MHPAQRENGGCPEDCAYCPQSSKHETSVGADARRQRGHGVRAARQGRRRDPLLCMGAAWREVKDGPAFDRVLDMVRGVKGMGMEGHA